MGADVGWLFKQGMYIFFGPMRMFEGQKVNARSSAYDPCYIVHPPRTAEALQDYILLCCQEKRGGLRDKPGK